MTTSPIDAIEQVSRRRKAYESSLSEICAVPKEQFVVITLDISEAVTTVLGRLEGIRALGPQMTQALPKFPIDLVDKLETYTLALDHTQILYKTSSAWPVPIKALAKSAIGFREILLADVNALISRDLIGPAALKNLKGVNGYKNIAFDLSALAHILKNNWAKISGRTGVTLEELDKAEVLAEQLQTAVGQHKKVPVSTTETVRHRQAAFTLFIRAYEEVRSSIEYLRRRQGDAESIAPSLYVRRSKGKKRPVDGTKAKPPKPSANSKSAQPELPKEYSPLIPDRKPDPGGKGPFMS